MLNVQLQLCFYMIVGYVLGKLNMLSKPTKKQISDLFINVFLPASTLTAFLVDMNRDVIINMIAIIALSSVYQIVFVLTNRSVYRNFDEDERICASYSMNSSNVSYVAYPILTAIYGDIGVLYATMLLIPQRVAMWTYGVKIFSKEEKVSFVKQLLTNPCMVAMYGGFVLCYLYNRGIYLPAFLTTCLKTMGSGSTMLCMIVVGANISELDIRSIFDRKSLYYCFMRLIAVPIIYTLLYMPLPISDVVRGVCIISYGCPGPIAAVAMAQKYDVNPNFASKLVATSSILSMITLLTIEKLVVK